MANPQDDKPTKPTLIESAMRHKTVVMAVVFALMAFGVYGLFNMPRNEFPNFTIRQGLVIGVYPGASARQVEEQLTSKVEQYLFGFEEVDKTKTYSYSRDGIAYIYVEVNKQVDRNGTAEFWNKLKNGVLIFQRTSLPPDVQGVIVNSDFGSTSAVLLAVESKTRPYKDLRHYVTGIENNLRQLEGLSKISDSGGLPEQVSLYVDNNKLAQYGLSAGQLVQTLQQQGSVRATGDLKTSSLNVPVHLSTFFGSETELADQIVKTDAQGQVVHLRDVATVRREYDPDPASYVTSGGVKSFIVSLEMQPGHNIVQFGKEVDARLTALERTFPPDIKLVKLANQPAVVDESISHFMREFGIALVAVVIVTLLLLPFRIAAVAGATIPITISCTLAIMFVLGIELNTVTLAALIIVLGIVVDDPIVVIDNHVEKLDHGLRVWDAARESARELFPSVFTATLAISAVFAPLVVFMQGTARDFLGDFPVTIVLALSLSLIISMLLVPAFNTLFIKKGLRQQEQSASNSQGGRENQPEKKTMLDRVQNGYNWLLGKAFGHTWLTLGLTAAAVLAGLFMMGRLPQQLFPTVERNQLAIEIYLPSGYNLARTDSVVKSMERLLAHDQRIEQYTSFIGSSSPRFHTLYAPNTPAPNYGQILVNTTTEETTVEVLREYARKYANAFPDAHVRMKQLSMGPNIPIEVRISGDSLRDLQAVANRVQALARNTQGVTWVRTDFDEMHPTAALRLLPNEAGRLGLSRQDLTNAVAMNLQGVQATQLWEEDYPVDVKVRVPLASRQSVHQLRDLLVASPSTRSVVPLRQVAEVGPAWEFGEIGRRNGVRTLTVRMDIVLGGLANNILAKLQPDIEKIKLPPGVAITYGGELEAQQENLTPMGLSLLLSVVILFFILLFHFQSIKHALLSLMTLPLSIFGASFGLLVLGYPFGFTSFLGLLSLCGIVVRNGIILTDFAGEMRTHEGLSVRDAAIHAGERRMRPIFLTSAAAAVGVIPMILSGSDLWGPLGAVICFGLLFSMVLTLFALPVLYWLFFRKEDQEKPQQAQGQVRQQVWLFLIMFLTVAATARAQQPVQTLTLAQTQAAALTNNVTIKNRDIGRASALEGVRAARWAYFPTVSGFGIGLYGFRNFIDPIPDILPKGINNFYLAGLSATETIYAGGQVGLTNRLARLQSSVSEVRYADVRDSVNMETEQKYWQVVQAQEQLKALQASERYLNQLLKELRDNLKAGLIARNDLLKVQVQRGQVLLNESKVRNGRQLALLDLGLFTGLPTDSTTVLTDTLAAVFNPASVYVPPAEAARNTRNHKLLTTAVEARRLQTRLKRASTLPSLSVGVSGASAGIINRGLGSTFTPTGLAIVNLPISNLWGSSRNQVRQQRLNETIAENNLQNGTNQLQVGIQQAYYSLREAYQQTGLATQTLAQATENLKVNRNSYRAGLNNLSDLLDAQASAQQAASQLISARAEFRLRLSMYQYLTASATK